MFSDQRLEELNQATRLHFTSLHTMNIKISADTIAKKFPA